MGSYLQRMWACRYFWMALVKTDLRTRYRGSVLGLGWSLLQPLCMTAILCVVFGSILAHNDIRYYGPYVLCGLSCWAFILNSVFQGCYCFQISQMYIRQYPAPMAIYPLRLVLGLAFHLLLALVVVLVLALVLREFSNPLTLLSSAPGTETSSAVVSRSWVSNPLALVSLIPSLLLLLVLGWSMATMAGLATVHFPDTKQITEVGFQALFYLTPVMLTEEILERLHLVEWFKYNPFFWYMRLLRDPILKGCVPPWHAYAAAALTAVVALAVAALALRRLEKRLIFHL